MKSYSDPMGRTRTQRIQLTCKWLSTHRTSTHKAYRNHMHGRARLVLKVWRGQEAGEKKTRDGELATADFDVASFIRRNDLQSGTQKKCSTLLLQVITTSFYPGIDVPLKVTTTSSQMIQKCSIFLRFSSLTEELTTKNSDTNDFEPSDCSSETARESVECKDAS
jgi:hypothetical protein